MGKKVPPCRGRALSKDYGRMQTHILRRCSRLPKRTRMATWWEFGVPCPIFPDRISRGKKISAKACTLQVWNVWMRRSRPKAGQNGTSRAMSIFVPRWKRKIHFQRYWIICRRIKSRWWEQFRIFPVRKAERIICFSRFEDFKGYPLPGQADNKRRPMFCIGRVLFFYSARVGWLLMVTATRLGIQTALCG